MAINLNGNGSVIISPEIIRDALLSLPVEERGFIVSNPASGEHKVFGIHWDENLRKVAVEKSTEPEL